jgi:predicted ATPase
VYLADDFVSVQVVSGSNMSGKSTLLRTIGINAVLAQSGAPVRARHLRLSSLAVGASIRTQDSLQENTSRSMRKSLNSGAFWARLVTVCRFVARNGLVGSIAHLDHMVAFIAF